MGVTPGKEQGVEERNVFLWGKAAVCAACGAFTAAFGWLGWLIAAWAACICLLYTSDAADEL